MTKRLPVFHRYSIRDLEMLSGIRAHTLRIWEQRYGMLHPQRTETNIRYYTDEELRYILNVSILNQNGFKISRIVKMPREAVEQEVARITSVKCDHESQIDALVLCMMNLDETAFDQVFKNNLSRMGFEDLITHIIYPFLEKVGALWISGSIRPLHEHFITNLIRHRMIAQIESLPRTVRPGAKKFLLFTPENEWHEIALLFNFYLLRRRRQDVLYIGLNVPVHDLVSVYSYQHPDYLVTCITSSPRGEALKKYLQVVLTQFSDSRIIISGIQIRLHPQYLKDNMLTFKDLKEFVNYVDKI